MHHIAFLECVSSIFLHFNAYFHSVLKPAGAPSRCDIDVQPADCAQPAVGGRRRATYALSFSAPRTISRSAANEGSSACALVSSVNSALE